MHAETLDARQSQSESGKAGASCVPSLLTPARKAALEALEREFSDLLNARRKVA